MKKQVRFIAARSALGLSLSLVLINQLAALAGTASDKTEWLTQNLSNNTNNQSLVVLKALPAKTDNRQKPQSIIVSCSNDSSHTIKLRPFMANRKLPSRQELELALIEQKAKLAEESNARLNGQVSTFIVGSENNSQDSAPSNWNNNQTNSSNTRTIAHKNYSRQNSTKAEFSNYSLMKQAEQRLLSAVMNKKNEANSASFNTPMLNSVANVSPNNISPNNIAPTQIMSGLSAPYPSMDSANNIAGNAPAGFPSGFPTVLPSNNPAPQTASAFGSAGSPPFPLNLVPEATLKQLIKSLASGMPSQRGAAPRASFGSWRGNSSNLAYAGFQTHLTAPRYQTMMKQSQGRYTASLPAVSRTSFGYKSSKATKKNSHNQKDISAQSKAPTEHQVQVASYPAYITQSLRAWNFAQQ